MNTNTRTYSCSEKTSLPELTQRLENFLRYSNMEVRSDRNQDGSITVLQARTRGGSFKQFVGMDKAVTVRINRVGDLLNVDIGESKWGDKAAVMAVSMFILWPLAVTSGVGIYQQKNLINNLWREIDIYMLYA